MKRILCVGLLALGLAAAAQPARADFRLQWNVCRSVCIEHTAKQRCLTYTTHSNPLSCAGGYGYGGMGGGYYGYGAPYYDGAAYAAAPAAATPSFTAPQPTPTPSATVSPTGLQQAGYFYYPPVANYGYGYGYGAGYAQAPNYWY